MANPDYFSEFKNIHFKREEGVLEVRLHTNDGPLEWVYKAGVNQQLIRAFEAVGRDADNKIVILTGTGEEFSGPEVPHSEMTGKPQYSGRPWVQVFEDIHRIIDNLLAIPVPMIAAINGPALRHCELPMLCDIVLSTEDTVFQDSAHYRGGLVPGDGKHVIYPMLMGESRGRYFMLTAEKMTAQDARQIGIVQEILPREQLVPRAWNLGRELAKQSDSVRRYTRLLMVDRIKRELSHSMSLGAALEGLGIWAADTE